MGLWKQIFRSGQSDEVFYRPGASTEKAPANGKRHGHGRAAAGHPGPIFDAAHYRMQCGDTIPASMSPLEHYLLHGARLSPHPLFDPDYYLEGLGGAADIQGSILEHYLANWKTHRINPHPLLDVGAYLEAHPDVVDAELDPLTHFILYGAPSRYNPHRLFDIQYYCEQNPDVAAAGVNPLTHFVTTGGFEGRDPNPWFDSSYYLETNPDVAEAQINPLIHYVRYGASEGRAPHPLVSNDRSSVERPLQDGPEGVVASFSIPARENIQPVASLRGPRRRYSPGTIVGSTGVNLIGWPRMQMGVAEQMREAARALLAAGLDFHARDISYLKSSEPGDDSIAEWIRSDCPHRVNLFVINADNMRDAYQALRPEELAQHFNIGCWHWELAEFPDVWGRELGALDELWLSSTFMQRAVSLKADVPVLYMPPAVTLPNPADLDRANFAIPAEKFVFLFAFDFTSYISRKNPYAALSAFRSAFPSLSGNAVLVIKTNNADRYPKELRELQETVGDDPRVVFIHKSLQRKEVASLLSLSDAFVSLHRAEGFGRALAESMLLGKPVIATNYSGNADFMTLANSCPVNYSLIPVGPGEYPHGDGQVWADPDIEHAAWYMRRLLDNRVYREWIGAAARDTMKSDFSPEIVGRRYLRRLRVLGLA